MVVRVSRGGLGLIEGFDDLLALDDRVWIFVDTGGCLPCPLRKQVNISVEVVEII